MLLEHIGDHSIVAVIGLCKNAGKTTTMCRLIRELEGTPIALTSVGRDGETTDLVTGTESLRSGSPKAPCLAPPGGCSTCAM